MNWLFALPVALLVAFMPRKEKHTVWLIGDSTIAIKDPKTYPETGWGMPFAGFFDSTIVVDNRARNGRSTRSFRAEGLWKQVEESLQPGDYVLIQFGHNDEVKEKVDRYTAPDEFKANLLQYVAETKARGAIPVLITPVTRRSFDSLGKIRETHPLYTGLVKEAAQMSGTPLIDLDEKSKALLQELGPERSRFLFNHLEPGEHPNYPAGKKDDTHFNELGARRMAELVLDEIRKSSLELKDRIIKR